MKPINTILLALMMINNAEPMPMELATRSAEHEPRVLLAQAEPEATQARTEGEDEEDDSPRAPSDQEALALAALEGLMSQPPERALPIIKRVLNGSQTTLVKRRGAGVKPRGRNRSYKLRSSSDAAPRNTSACATQNALSSSCSARYRLASAL